MIPASSVSHSEIDRKLWPSARAALISGQSAQIWPDLVSGFLARRCARRFRVSGIQLSANNAPHIPREWERGFGTRDGQKIFVEETIGGRSQQSATVSGGRNNPQQFETDRNRRQQQRESQAAKNPVVEHKGIVEHWGLFFALKSFDLSAFMLGDTSRGLSDGCSTVRIFGKT